MERERWKHGDKMLKCYEYVRHAKSSNGDEDILYIIGWI